MKLSDDEIEEIEQAVDRAFMKVVGRTYRNDELPPAIADSFDNIVKDFPSLFGTS